MSDYLRSFSSEKLYSNVFAYETRLSTSGVLIQHTQVDTHSPWGPVHSRPREDYEFTKLNGRVQQVYSDEYAGRGARGHAGDNQPASEQKSTRGF